GRVDDPAVTAAIDRVVEACRAAGMPLGYFGVTAAAVKPYIERGCTLIVAGVDTLFLGSAAKNLLAELRSVLSGSWTWCEARRWPERCSHASGFSIVEGPIHIRAKCWCRAAGSRRSPSRAARSLVGTRTSWTGAATRP